MKLDPLGAFFVLLISLSAVAISIYSIGYAAHYYGVKNVGALAAFFNLLLLANTLVFCASHAVFLLVVWEVMALAAFVLVSFEHEEPKTRQAGVLFFVMSHIGTGCLILGFLLLYQSQLEVFGLKTSISWGHGFRRSSDIPRSSFSWWDSASRLGSFPCTSGCPKLTPWPLPTFRRSCRVCCSRAASTGCFAFSWIFWGPRPPGGASLCLCWAQLSALLGVLYALVQKDLKRLLAFSSLENIGIILMGIGASLMLSAFRQPVLAALALVAALYHTLNHACFKGLLFLGAGAVLNGAHTRDLEKLGGLIRRMPKTAFFFLLGAIALCGFPPLNGFVSEWLTYQALLQGFSATERLVRLNFPIAGALLALTGALAAACFVKAMGITFLSLPRSPQAEGAHEASPSMLLGMGLFGLACIFLGLFPQVCFG